ncbi:tandem-95 repeat protein [Neobacillus sp. PS2-9]|uniref:tandem-95 repeat protein n=1 Tax=Neobacillus sp. PS2-9 TaxID=3070676 RepID=UPI0027DFB514|nr:Ig-like domain-containing protein [Neobacillus sp. PS2-9]WML58936.1 Ig-like domain-containing protein [Neobacillus sp. PS2-9]
MKETNFSLFPLSKKGFITIFSSAVILSSAATNLVNAQTIDNSKIVFSEDIDWMKPNATLNGEEISIDFSKRFSSYFKDGAIQLEAASSSNIVSVSVSERTLNLNVKSFGESVIKVTARDSEGKAVTDQFHLKITQKGDLNGDGMITPADALLIYQVTSGKVTLTTEQMKLLDINGDGKITNADASELMTNYVGKKPMTTADRNFFVVFTEVNDAPIANDDHFTVEEDETLKVESDSSILKNDIDVDVNSLAAKKMSNPAHGDLTLNQDGTFTYVPDKNFNGDDQFTYKVSDGKVDSDERTVSIKVESVNDAPVAEDGTLKLKEDIQAEGMLTGTDVEDLEIAYTIVDNGKKGKVTITDLKTGAYTYTPNPNENGKDSFTFKVNDGTADSEVATVEVTIQAVNDAPVAKADSFKLKEDGTLTVDANSSILKNDEDVEGDLLTAKLVSGTAHGKLTLNGNGTFTYEPKANFNGTDQFVYKANDGELDSEKQTVTIEVEAVNDAPVAEAGTLKVTEDTQAEGKLSGTDVEDSELTYTIMDNGKKGTVTITDAKTGAYTYTPNPNENGIDSFTYKVNDGTADSEVATVEVNIQSVNDAPVAQADSFKMKEDETITVDPDSNILNNDEDVEGSPLTVKLVSGTAHGKLTLNEDGTFTYEPNANFNGTDQFVYKANDGELDSEEQIVTIEIESVYDVPVAENGTLKVTEDTQTEGRLSGTDVEGLGLTYTIMDNGQKGTVTITDAKTGAYTYTPNPNENGKDSFTYKVNDGTADSEVATVEVNIQAVNDAPVAQADSFKVKEDETITVDPDSSILNNDEDVEGDPLTTKLVNGTAHGKITLHADGTFTYEPKANFNGTDQFVYKVNDGELDSEEQIVTIEVQAVNDVPVAENGTLKVTEDIQVEGNLTGTDVEGSELTYTIVDNGKKGTVTITDPKTGAYTYTPNPNENGKDSFTFKVNDGTADSEVATVEVTIHAVNDAPAAQADSFKVKEDETLTVDANFSILKNDEDVEGSPLTVKLVTGTDHGKLTLNEDGTFTYEPKANFNGTDHFVYKVNDGELDSEEQTVTIKVEAVNDVPVAEAGTLKVTEDIQAEGKLTGTDVEDSELTYTIVDNGKKGKVMILDPKTGAYTYTPNSNENGKGSFTFKVNDGTADSEVATVEVTIEAVNDAPTISDLSINGKLVMGETVNGTYMYTDVENDVEGSSVYQWYRGKQEDGSDKTPISGANSKEYIIKDVDENYYLFFEVTPVAVTGEQANQPFIINTTDKVAGLTSVLTIHPDPYRPDPLAPITEADLKSQGGTFITVDLTNDQFKDTISENDFVLNHAPDGMTIVSAMLLDDTTAGLLLQYDGLDFDYDITDFSVTAKDTATLKGKAVTSNNMTIKASVDAQSAFISEYLQGSTIDRSAIEIYYTGDGTSNPVTGLQLEVHQWDVAKGQKKVWSLPLNPVTPNMPYIVINSIFYDFFDITNNWYYNDEAFIAMPGLINNAFVLKKDGKVIDTVGNPFVNGPEAILPNGGTMVRKMGIRDGLSPYDKNQWALYPVDTFQYIGNHTP